MNVIILTPDRVGSTLLQRLITIYMAGHEYDKPVINLHELTNGLHLYYNTTYNREILGKPPQLDKWGYHQSLEEIVNLLDKADHYKTARLAEYHIITRKDSVADQIRFYEYINKNFFVIAGRRENLFEHGISWSIASTSKKLNVYSHVEKLNVFHNIYKNGITIDPVALTDHLSRYKSYLRWVDNNFQVSSYFNYEKDLKNIENYILNLDIFPNQEKKSWNDIFSIEWSDWNKCHKLLSDLGSVEDIKLLEYNDDKSKELVVLDKLKSSLSLVDQNYLLSHGEKYVKAADGIDLLVKNGTLLTGVPIKLQTMAEKRNIIKNFDECIETYNNWVDKNGLGTKYTNDDIKLISNNEVKEWYQEVPKNLLLE
jgi:hypothetical protein